MKYNIVWTQSAKADLIAIRDFIARDAPKVAILFVQRLKQSVERLRTFPYSGQIVAELAHHGIREILFGNYRIMYRVNEQRIELLMVYHSARLLDTSED
jgi:addiction module RelE/StbE family toxin